MALRYALIQGVLIGMAGHHKEALHPDHVVQVIQSFSKGVEHNPESRAEMRAIVEEAKLTTSEGFAVMLRN